MAESVNIKVLCFNPMALYNNLLHSYTHLNSSENSNVEAPLKSMMLFPGGPSSHLARRVLGQFPSPPLANNSTNNVLFGKIVK